MSRLATEDAVPHMVPLPLTWESWAEALLPRVTRLDARVLVDGRSGSGKSTLADHLVRLAASRGHDLQCVRVEDLYPGWDGLAAGSAAVVSDVLRPLRDHGSATWRTHDWHADAPGDLQTACAASPLLVEGTGAISRDSAVLATWTIWVEADESSRRRRAFARDGETYRPHWHRWAAQEEAFLAEQRPRELADLVIDAGTIEETT